MTRPGWNAEPSASASVTADSGAVEARTRSAIGDLGLKRFELRPGRD